MHVDMHAVPKFEKEGYMWKQGGKVKSWKRRWFILYGKHIAYYEKDESTALGKLIAKGCIHIHDVKCEPTKSSKFPAPSAPFLLHANERVFLLVADSIADRLAWMSALKRVNDRPPAIFCQPCQRLVDLSRCAQPLKVGDVRNTNSGKTNYLVLAQGHLAYYNAREDVGTRMALNLVHLNEDQCFVTQKSEKQFEIKLKQASDVVSFESPECTKWVHTLNQVILSDEDPAAVAAAAAGAAPAPNNGNGAGGHDDDSSSPLEGAAAADDLSSSHSSDDNDRRDRRREHRGGPRRHPGGAAVAVAWRVARRHGAAAAAVATVIVATTATDGTTATDAMTDAMTDAATIAAMTAVATIDETTAAMIAVATIETDATIVAMTVSATVSVIVSAIASTGATRLRARARRRPTTLKV
jgi:hypothetical protein